MEGDLAGVYVGAGGGGEGRTLRGGSGRGFHHFLVR